MPTPSNSFNFTEHLARLEQERAKLKRGLLARNTYRGYGHDWSLFERWCKRMDLPALPASTETVGLYLTDLLDQGRKVTTAARHACAIAHQHRAGGLESPVTREIRRLLTGARQLLGQPPREMTPLSVGELRRIVGLMAADGRPKALRDRAMLVLGFASALRRSNLVAMRLEDIEFCSQGLVIQIRREKNDQSGRGRLIALPAGEHPETCPAGCLRAWLDVRPTGSEWLFTGLRKDYRGQQLRGEAVCRLVKASVQRIGVDPAQYGGHSLRSGMISEAGENNVEILRIAAISGHRCLNVLQKYFRKRDLWRANAAGKLGL